MEARVCEKCGIETAETVDGLCGQCQSIHAQTLAPEPSTPPPEADTQQPLDGEAFGEYELIEEVARGGMGVIYKARHTKLNRIVAIKMILSGRFSSDEELQRFHIEAEAAAKLDHPGIVPVYDIGEVDGQAFFAMKFINGTSLADHVGRLRSDSRQAIQLLSKVATAVHHAHQRGVLHRDLKPANILIDSDGEALITDLGLAKNEQSNSNLTNTGAVLGTPSYMPPEQASGNAIITTAVDVYSLGAIMYELLTGVPPYQGKTAIETVMQVLEGPPEAPHRLQADIDRDLSMICMKCLEPNPDARYASAAQLADDMNSWLAGDSISIKPPSVAERARRWFRKNKRLAYSGFAVAVGILITLPFALDLVASQQFAGVYDRFPESERPLLFSLSTKLPEWWGLVAALFLVLVLWPSIGWLIARMAEPKSVLQAAIAGARTSLFLCVMLGLLMGWLIVGRTVATASQRQTRTLAEAVWPSDSKGTIEEKREAAEAMYEGLDQIPVAERADVVTARMKADQVAMAPLAMGVFLLVFAILSVPVIYGTILGYVLIQRKNHFILGYFRYIVAWWTALFGTAMAFSLVVGGNVRFNNSSRAASITPRLVILTLAALVTWLLLRRWKRDKTDPLNSNPALSSVN
ncbi:MAG: protein kinase [Planctomycetaceae bacterium]